MRWRHSHPLVPCSAPCSRFCIATEAVPFVSSLPRACHASANLPRRAVQAHSCRRTVALVFPRPALFSRPSRHQTCLRPHCLDKVSLACISLPRSYHFGHLGGESALTGAIPRCCGWLHPRLLNFTLSLPFNPDVCDCFLVARARRPPSSLTTHSEAVNT